MSNYRIEYSQEDKKYHVEELIYTMKSFGYGKPALTLMEWKSIYATKYPSEANLMYSSLIDEQES